MKKIMKKFDYEFIDVLWKEIVVNQVEPLVSVPINDRIWAETRCYIGDRMFSGYPDLIYNDLKGNKLYPHVRSGRILNIL